MTGPGTAEPPFDDPAWIERSLVIVDSFERWLRRPLVARGASTVETAGALFEAPFVVVAHGTESDPLLNYANRAALALWETDLQTLLGMPSRLTAEPTHRDERARMLERTQRDGYVDDYRGIRISTTGRRFRIDQAYVWNLINASGANAGQAASFARWERLGD